MCLFFFFFQMVWYLFFLNDKVLRHLCVWQCFSSQEQKARAAVLDDLYSMRSLKSLILQNFLNIKMTFIIWYRIVLAFSNAAGLRNGCFLSAQVSLWKQLQYLNCNSSWQQKPVTMSELFWQSKWLKEETCREVTLFLLERSNYFFRNVGWACISGVPWVPLTTIPIFK